ncbi:CoA transferase [Mesobacterium sp. TK19101]|uniref:CoA transferase n=1 Tax=Mesobacterium hydrothermale TaxID=3111907 RepID=A0ABU6HKP9_9RHOB|nr:CoA transferase [Mesobacterium sp. TK19101]MEC3863038.1 CoA transferase [Mesobacterium sp. TK19101]
MTGPLQGIRILDLSRILAGPYATQLLADMGADVIKVERPGAGDDTRAWGPPYVTDDAGHESRESAYYLAANRNKRSIAVDMTDPAQVDRLRQMAGRCDVVIENFKRGGLCKYGLDHATLCAAHPRLVYCSITGYGQTGPNADKPGYDLMAQAYAGIMAITGAPGADPMKVGVGIADMMCGMYASTAILAALRHRDATGEGQHIDLALVDATMSWLANAGTNFLMDGSESRFGNQHPNIVPYQVFQASDGHLIVAAGNDRQFAAFCGILGLDALARDPRFATNPSRLDHRDTLIALLQDRIVAWRKADLIAAMDRAGVPGGPIHTLPEVFASDQAQARGIVVRMDHPDAGPDGIRLIGNPVKFSRTPVTYRRPPPRCGEHTQEIRDEFFPDMPPKEP